VALIVSKKKKALIKILIWRFTAFPPSFQRLHSLWKKRFGEEVDEDLIYVVAVEQVLQLEDFKEVSWCYILSCFDL
jgi:hypothetical protein